jgi:magnesium and cobalt transporter
MLKMIDNTEESVHASASASDFGSPPVKHNGSAAPRPGLLSRIIAAFKGRQDTSLREAIEEYIEEPQNEDLDPVALHELGLFSNILKLRDLRVVKVMVPRADIAAIDITTSQEELFALLAEKQYSRIPVYKDTLDDVLGTIHLKDIMEVLAKGQPIKIKDLLTEIPIVSPSMPVLDLLMTMRDSRRHMALVVDEYGGIDGLVTIGDVIEAIVGEIDDEHDSDEAKQLVLHDDGTVLVDARVDIDDFEDEFGQHFSDSERAESETLGGLVFTLAGRVPVRGEVIKHDDSGISFEIIDADQRRIKRMKLSKIPNNSPGKIAGDTPHAA